MCMLMRGCILCIEMCLALMDKCMWWWGLGLTKPMTMCTTTQYVGSSGWEGQELGPQLYLFHHSASVVW